ncbi:MAG: sporulation initiation factor Spo0A C-terminal domain-containing protein [Clostridia bacterium]
MVRVMIVDDNESLKRELGAFFNRKSGIKMVGTACNGIEAEHLLTTCVPDVLLLDLVMPQMDGIDLLVQLHKKALCPDMRVIMVSSMMQDHVIRRAVDAGADYCMAKPLNPAFLYDRILDIGQDRLPGGVPLQAPASLAGQISECLKRQGVPARMKGFSYLCDAIERTYNAELHHLPVTKLLYPEIARKYATTSTSVEHAIRTAIETAFKHDALEHNGIFSDERRPTNHEFILRMTQLLKS